ncbi:MAG: tripartite tricarboxylate transporter TctB family protein [Pseudomonadota bacterium]
MLRSDRVFGLVVVLVALAFVASAFQLQTSFMSDPLGPKAFPILVGSVAAICGLVMILKPDEEPEWPGLATLGSLAFSVALLIGYAYSLKPFGFLLPTAVCAGVLSYQITPKPVFNLITGVGLAVLLFLIFKYVLGLGLIPFPKDLSLFSAGEVSAPEASAD